MRPLWVVLASAVSIITFASPAWSQEWTCVNESNGNFTTVWRVKSLPAASVYHVSSFNPANGRSFDVNKKVNIIGKKNEYIYAYIPATSHNLMNFYVFDTAGKTYTQSGHYLDIERTPNAQFFVCK